MKKIKLLGIAMFALVIVLAACPGPTGTDGDGEEPPQTTSVNNTARGGTFSLGEGAVQFNFGKTTPGLSSSVGRAVSQADGKSITIYIKDADDIYELTGILDNTSGKFSVSSKGDNKVLYQMDGAIEDGDVLYTTMIRKKRESDGTWTLESSTAEPEASVSIAGDKGGLEAGLPASWQGLWEMSGESERIILSGFSVAGDIETNLSIIQSERINDSTYDAYITMPAMTMAPFDSTVLDWLRELMDGGTHTVTFDAATDTVKLDSDAALPLGYDLEEDSVYIGKIPVLPSTVTKLHGGENDSTNFYGWQASRRKSAEYVDTYKQKLLDYENEFKRVHNEQAYLAWMKGEEDPFFGDILNHLVTAIADIPVSTEDDYIDTRKLIDDWYESVNGSWTEEQKGAFMARRGIFPYYRSSLQNMVSNNSISGYWNNQTYLTRNEKAYFIFGQMSYKDWMSGKPDGSINERPSIQIGGSVYPFQYPQSDNFFNITTLEAMKTYVGPGVSEYPPDVTVFYRDESYRLAPYFAFTDGMPVMDELKLAWIKTQSEYIAEYNFLSDCATWQEAKYDIPQRLSTGWDSSEQGNAVMMYQTALFRKYMDECKPQMGTGISKVRLQSAGSDINCYFYMNGNDDTITQEVFNTALSTNSDPFPGWATEAVPDIVFTR